MNKTGIPFITILKKPTNAWELFPITRVWKNRLIMYKWAESVQLAVLSKPMTLAYYT